MTQQEIFEIIVRNIKEVLPNLDQHAFQSTDSMKALGLNSVDRSEVLMLTLEALSVKIPLIEMAAAPNIGELAGIIHAKL